eukprot:338977-Amphidinium_carterae.1
MSTVRRCLSAQSDGIVHAVCTKNQKSYLRHVRVNLNVAAPRLAAESRKKLQHRLQAQSCHAQASIDGPLTLRGWEASSR